MAAAVRRPLTTLSCALATLLLAVGLVRGDRLAFNFFPTPEGQILFASVSFVAGTPPERVERFIGHLERTLKETEAHFGEGARRHGGCPSRSAGAREPPAGFAGRPVRESARAARRARWP